MALAPDERGLRAFARRQLGRLAGTAVLAGVAFTLAALGTWNVDDPSFSHATDNLVTTVIPRWPITRRWPHSCRPSSGASC